jgi:hypothetical protein
MFATRPLAKTKHRTFIVDREIYSSRSLHID